jgi:hypothetical protein
MMLGEVDQGDTLETDDESEVYVSTDEAAEFSDSQWDGSESCFSKNED